MFRESAHIACVGALAFAFALELYAEAKGVGGGAGGSGKTTPTTTTTTTGSSSSTSTTTNGGRDDTRRGDAGVDIDAADVPLVDHAASGSSGKDDEDLEGGVKRRYGEASSGASSPWSAAALMESPAFKCLTLRRDALRESRTTIQAWAELSVIMFLFWFCDRSGLVRESKKSYDRDLLIAIFVALAAYGWKTTLKESRTSSPLHREQTEEMKGWMQVLFLLYHYFDAGEMYNLIRVFIAAYVWMTGFGNFSYYYVKKDFSAVRFAQMMWRLNFFVLVTCLVMKNDYMLYYICPMHTLFTLFVYGALAVFKDRNSDAKWIYGKFIACFAISAVIWEVPGVFNVIFKPFSWLLGYVNPAKPNVPAMHEWEFRSGLDRYVWIYGMMCAYAHPKYEAFMKWIDDRPTNRERVMYQGGVVATACAILYWWFVTFFTMDKFDYNKWHPYTSWIPVTGFILLRNATKTLRMNHIDVFCICGKVTLETYISQFHIWLSTSGTPNGQPKMLMSLVPGYPLLNFMLCTYIYIGISHRIFDVTNILKSACIPSKDNAALVSNAVVGSIIIAASLGLGVFSSLMFTGET